jgi:hypothetical protein
MDPMSNTDGKSTEGGKTAREIMAENAAAIDAMSADELAAFMGSAADQAQASQAELTAEADARRARRYQAN